MAKVTAPILSLNAQGMIARKLVFQKRGGSNAVYWNKGHSDNISDGTGEQRAKFDTAKNKWLDLSDNEKQEYNIKAKESDKRGMTGYNLYVKEEITRIKNNPPELKNEDFLIHATKMWTGCDIARDGDLIGMCIMWGRIWIKENGAWSEERPAGDTDKNWGEILIAEDNSVRVASQRDGRIYVKREGVWAEEQPGGDMNRYYLGGDISDNGEVIIVGAWPGRLYVYRDGSWVDQQLTGDEDGYYRQARLNHDGSKAIAIKGPNNIYIYENGQWNIKNPTVTAGKSYRDVAISGDGKTMLAVTEQYNVYIRENKKWRELDLSWVEEKYPWVCAINHDGKRYVVGNYNRGWLYWNGYRWQTMYATDMQQNSWERVKIAKRSEIIAGSSVFGWAYTYM